MNEKREALEVTGISKTYARLKAVDDLSFEVSYGEIFGLLGPNGAGKTTTIRMVLDIIKPDQGRINILGGQMTEAKKNRIGYLPEERGLYEEMKLLDVLVYLGQLKGLSQAEAVRRAKARLQEVDLWEVNDSKISALSRGMGQKAQFVAATLHDPHLIIIDEPFSGLDPVNTRVIKDLIYRMRDRGAAIIMSTHQMNQVEEMCQRILLIDHGQRVLYGPLEEVRSQFAPNAVEVEISGDLPDLPAVEQAQERDSGYRLVLQAGFPPEQLLKDLVASPRVVVKRFERVEPSLDEIFVRVVGNPVLAEGTPA